MIQISANGSMRRIMQTGARGGSTSAVSACGRCGVAVPKASEYISGEGWVRWSQIFKQVDRAYQAWRVKKSLQGVWVAGGFEAIQADVDEALARKAKRLGARKSST